MNLASIRNVLFNWMGMAAGILYGFFLIPVVIRGLGDTHYGLWNLIMSCVGYMAVLDFGIQTAVNRYVARDRGLGDAEGVNAVYSNALVMYSFIALAALLAGVTVALNIERIIRIDPGDMALARNVMLLMAVFAAIELPSNVFGAVLYAYQRFDLLNGITMAMLGFQAVFVWLAMTGGVGLWGYAWILFGLGMAKYVVQFILSHRVAGALRFRSSLLSRSTVRMMLTFSGITFLSIIVNYIIFKTDNIVIGIFLSPQAITFYSIGFMLSDYVAQIVGRMCNTFTPMFSEYEARGEQGSFLSLLLTSSRFSTLIGIPAGLTVIVVGRDFIHLWLGQGYEQAYTVMVILMVSRMAGFPTASMSSMLFGIGKHYINLYTGVFEAVMNIALSVILVRHYGIVGVALGTMVPMILANMFYPVLVCWSVGLNLRQWVFEGVLRPGAMCALFFGVISMSGMLFPQVVWTGFLGRIMAIGAVYAVLFWFLGLRGNERSVLIDKLGIIRH